MAQPELTLVELRNRLFGTFKQRKISDLLKTQLRAQMLAEMRIPAASRSGAEQTLRDRVLNSVIVDYLRKKNLCTTLSVFLPESGLSELSQALPRADMVTGMHIDPSSQFCSRLIAAIDSKLEEPVLQVVLQEIAMFRDAARESVEVQTEAPPASSLESRLRELDQQFQHRVSSAAASASANGSTLEERMYRYERECEARMQATLTAEVERIRELEVAQMRLQEHDRHQRALADCRAELEKKYSERLERLAAREKEFDQRVSARERELETSEFASRQKSLNELNRLRLREQELQDQLDAHSQSSSLFLHRLQEQEAALKVRGEELQRLREQLNIKQKDDFVAFKVDFERSHAEQVRALQRQREHFDEEAEKLRAEQQKHSTLVADALATHNALNAANRELIIAKQRNENNAILIQQLKDQNEELNESVVRSRGEFVRSEREVRELNIENARMRSELARKESAATVNVHSLTSELDALKGQVLAAQEQALNERNNSAERLRAHEAQMAGRLESYRKAVADADARTAAVKAQFELKVDEGEALKRQIEDLELHIRSLSRDLLAARQAAVVPVPVPVAAVGAAGVASVPVPASVAAAALRSPAHRSHGPGGLPHSLGSPEHDLLRARSLPVRRVLHNAALEGDRRAPPPRDSDLHPVWDGAVDQFVQKTRKITDQEAELRRETRHVLDKFKGDIMNKQQQQQFQAQVREMRRQAHLEATRGGGAPAPSDSAPVPDGTEMLHSWQDASP
eukprot:gnl/Spiro4/23656_TR11698_c0_g1_i1.p1 gnl/Spiro4/23656_TR11698_c0_g1~~gnl/Spiro4/23656_TR11698_c0_g1_i1.p1  ORF type:complete len:745 (-),score=260.53 gnl/Spiro4/23656_TR11698_c0_g1_i1:48-2282(-)